MGTRGGIAGHGQPHPAPPQAEPPEPPRDAFTGEAPEWEVSPGDTDAEPWQEWPDGTVPLDRRSSPKKLIHTLRRIYPVLCTIVFLFLGFFLNAWHPGWLIFLTIPIFHSLTAS